MEHVVGGCIHDREGVVGVLKGVGAAGVVGYEAGAGIARPGERMGHCGGRVRWSGGIAEGAG